VCCARSRVQESIPAGVGVFQQKPEQDQEWIFFIGIGAGAGAGAGVIFSRVFLTFRCTFTIFINCYTGVKQEQESINFSISGVTPGAGVNFEAQE